MVRSDKSDPAPDLSLWDRIIADCGVTPVGVGERVASRTSMTQEELAGLLDHNLGKISGMDVASGAMLKGLILELQRDGRGTYMRLGDPLPGGHSVPYEFVQGDRAAIGRTARALGFKSVTETSLEALGG